MDSRIEELEKAIGELKEEVVRLTAWINSREEELALQVVAFAQMRSNGIEGVTIDAKPRYVTNDAHVSGYL